MQLEVPGSPVPGHLPRHCEDWENMWFSVLAVILRSVSWEAVLTHVLVNISLIPQFWLCIWHCPHVGLKWNQSQFVPARLFWSSGAWVLPACYCVGRLGTDSASKALAMEWRHMARIRKETWNAGTWCLRCKSIHARCPGLWIRMFAAFT